MYELKSYVEGILKGLYVNKKQKQDMYDEFIDHLESLKQEYLGKGLEEIDAIKKAIECFGNSSMLKSKLAKVNTLRNIPNFLFGISFIFIIYFIEKNIWMIRPSDSWMTDLKFNFVWMIGGLFGILPFAYFMPLILKRANNILLISSFSILFAIINLKIQVWGSSYQIYPAYIIGNILGGISGLILIRIINKFQWLIRNELLKI